MPAPLAKGLILSLSLLFAAGAAVYENPQVKQWVTDNRRKVAIALHNLGDELAPEPRRRPSNDASTREDDAPDAVERRRRAREEILNRGRLMEERKRAASQPQGKGICFDDLVEKDGTLKKEEESNARTTAAESQPENAGLRHRAAEPTIHTPVGQDYSRSSTPTLPISPPVPPKPAAYQLQRQLIDADEASSHPSEHLDNFTATSPSSSAADDLVELSQSAAEPTTEMYMSVNEWAQNQTVQSFHSPPESVSRNSTPTVEEAEGSIAESIEHASQAGTEDADVMSEFDDGINTPSTWTEVGSQASEV